MPMFRTMTLALATAVALGITAGCQPKAPAGPSAPTVNPGPATPAQAESDEGAGAMGPTGEESRSGPAGESAASPAPEVRSPGTETVESLMEHDLKPAVGALKQASSTGQMENAAEASRTLIAAAENLRAAPDAPADDDFVGYVDDLVMAAGVVAKTAEDGRTRDLSGSVADVEASCKACHDVYRKD